MRTWIPCGLLILIGSLGLVHEANAQRTTFSSSDDHESHHVWQNNDERLEIWARGEIVFSSDDAEVERISPGGYLKIEEKKGRQSRRLEVQPDNSGTLQYEFWVNGQKRPFHNESREDVAELLLYVIRQTGIGAEQRVARILREEGVDGVFLEIGQIKSSSASRRYLTALLDQGELNEPQRNRLAKIAATQITSSGDRAHFLIDASPYYLDQQGKAYVAYFETARTIPSSGDQTRVLLHAMEEYDLHSDALYELLRSAKDISSSGDKSRVLIGAVPEYDNSEAIRSAYFEAVGRIPSSGDHTRVLLAFIEGAKPDQASITALFSSARGINSSGDKSRLLTQAAPHFVNDAAQRDAFFDAVNTIPSSGDHARVLIALLKDSDLDKASLAAVLASARDISSSGDKTRVLLEAADHLGSDDDLVTAYLDAADTIPSPGDHSRALTALVKKN